MTNVTLNINNKKCIQEHFKGAGGVYHHYATALDFPERRYTEEQQNIEFERVANMELKLARTYFDFSAYKQGVWDWENNEMVAFYKWLSAMKEHGVTVMINACWWLGSHIYTDENSPFYDANPYIAAEKYGKWVSDLVYNIVEKRGFSNVKYLIMFTEPNDSTVKLNKLYPELSKYETYGIAVRAAHEHLLADNRRHLVKLVGPNEAAISFSWAGLLKYSAKNLADCFDVFSAHMYLLEDISGKVDIETKSGYCAVKFNIPGYRLWQTVEVEPDTEYIFSFFAKAEKELNIDERGIYFGAFRYNNEYDTEQITAGNMGISNLSENSVTFISSEKVANKWKKYSHVFNSGENNEALVGVFHDTTQSNGSIFYDDFSLVKKGSTEELLLDTDLELGGMRSPWQLYPNCTPLENKNDTFREYSYWYDMARGYMSVLPEGKEFCLDEYNTTYLGDYNNNKQGIRLAIAQSGLMNAGVNSSLVWSLFDQFWPRCTWDGFDKFVNGEHRHGIMPVISRSLVPYKSYYAFTLLSKYLGNGDARVFEGDFANDVCVSFLNGSDGYYTILLVNASDKEKKINLNFCENLNVEFKRHLYDSENIEPNEKAEIIGVDKTIYVDNLLCDILPANSFAIYTTRED